MASTKTKKTAAKKERAAKAPAKSRCTRQVFLGDHSIKVTVAARSKVDYFQIEEALKQALAEVRHRIANNSQLY